MDDSIFNKYLSQLANNITILPDKPEETPFNTLKALWLKAAGTPVSVIKAEKYELPELSEQTISDLEYLIARRLTNVPLAHLTERQSFMGIEMISGPEALIPRKETEILGFTAVEILKSINDEIVHVIDVCTGAGNIALALANYSKVSKIYAADLSEDAINLAKRNAALLNLTSQVSFYCGNLLEPLENLGINGKVKLLTCNPPYISSSKVANMPDEISSFEPSLAFDGGVFGINLVRKLIMDAQEFLCENGYLVMEVGLGQGEIIMKQVEKSMAYMNIRAVNDIHGNPRVIVAQKI